jgi:hypothetical protein
MMLGMMEDPEQEDTSEISARCCEESYSMLSEDGELEEMIPGLDAAHHIRCTDMRLERRRHR